MSEDIRHAMVAMIPRLRAFARSLAGSADAADDLVQATCERALRNVESWQPGTRLDSWMFRIMRNHWIDVWRARRPETPLGDPDAGYDIAGEDGAATAESRLMLGSVMGHVQALPEDQRSVLVLVCVEGLSYREAAGVLDVPIGTVMSRLARARKAVADAMDGGVAAAGGAR